MGKTSTASKNRWNAANYDRIQMLLPKGYKDRLLAAAGEGKVTAFIREAIDVKLKEIEAEEEQTE